MLKTLHIKNFALIDRLTLEFGPGFNVFSGETGAGKSILVGAINLIIGGKGDTSLIRTGTDEASVTAEVRISEAAMKELQPWFTEHGIEPDGDVLIIKRVLRSGGRGSIYLQSEPAALKDLQYVAGSLFDLHGQHEHQSILYDAGQRKLLDAYAQAEQLREAFTEQQRRLKADRKRLERWAADEQQQLREQDMLAYAVDEIDRASLAPGEDEQLQQELHILSKSEQLSELVDESISLLYGSSEERGALSGLKSAVSMVRKACDIDASLEESHSQMESALYEIEDAYEKVRSYRDHLDFSPQRIDQLHERLQLIHSLKRKYSPKGQDLGSDGIAGILAFRDEAADKIAAFEHRTEDREELERRCRQLEEQLGRTAEQLTAVRLAASERLGPAVTRHLALLGMPKADFQIAVTQEHTGETLADAPPHGADTITFLISPNTGEPLKDLKQIASGGELSRVMLALKTEFSAEDTVDTLIFDEIDTGIGGSVASSVGKHLLSLARSRQVLCITHLASIAAAAQSHFTVFKREKDGRTVTEVAELSREERVGELARMLSGDPEAESAAAHARDLLGH
jgi:DNA repair protein RecN (Recombination protein N)